MELITAHDRQIMAVIYRFSGDLYDREDLYQEIFLRCYKAIRSFRYQSKFSTWLYRVALNCCIDYMKRNPVLEPLESELSGNSALNEDERAKLRAIQVALTKLSRKQRICFHMFYVEEWSTEEIANMLNLSEGSVKSHLNRSRQKIRSHQRVWIWNTST